MQKKDYFKLGKIRKVNFKGEIVFFFNHDINDNFEDLDFVFIEINKGLIPFFIDSIKIKDSKTAVIKFEDVDEGKGKKLVNLNFFVEAEKYENNTPEALFNEEIIGYTVIDSNHGDIGIVNEILELPQHSVIQIINNKIEILIPIAEEIINNIDPDNKIIEISAPEGLIDLYLQ